MPEGIFKGPLAGPLVEPLPVGCPEADIFLVFLRKDHPYFRAAHHVLIASEHPVENWLAAKPERTSEVAGLLDVVCLVGRNLQERTARIGFASEYCRQILAWPGGMTVGHHGPRFLHVGAECVDPRAFWIASLAVVSTDSLAATCGSSGGAEQ